MLQVSYSDTWLLLKQVFSQHEYKCQQHLELNYIANVTSPHSPVYHSHIFNKLSFLLSSFINVLIHIKIPKIASLFNKFFNLVCLLMVHFCRYEHSENWKTSMFSLLEAPQNVVQKAGRSAGRFETLSAVASHLKCLSVTSLYHGRLPVALDLWWKHTNLRVWEM